ncbi:similar to protein kinase, partial sequence [Botrytis cinerea T4]|uniref:Similar to protein kinase, partial sequence n=1 Tax=Botryotinia fuckeliana (strain T4) TaxID=999810 RepID=G2XV52_BOTF4
MIRFRSMYSILPRRAFVSLVHFWDFDDFDDFTTLRFYYCICSHCDRFESHLAASSKKKRHCPSCGQTVHTVHTTSYTLLATCYSLLVHKHNGAKGRGPQSSILPVQSSSRPVAQSSSRPVAQPSNGKDLGHKPPTLTTLTFLSHLESRKGTGNIKLLSHSQHQQPVTGTYRYRLAIHSPKYCSTPLSLSAAAKRLTLHTIKKIQHPPLSSFHH